MGIDKSICSELFYFYLVFAFKVKTNCIEHYGKPCNQVVKTIEFILFICICRGTKRLYAKPKQTTYSSFIDIYDLRMFRVTANCL